MVLNVVHLDRPEGAEAHMQCNVGQFYTHVLDLFQQFRGKVQPRCGSGGRAGDLGIDRLIPFLILQFLFNIRWQGHTAQPLQNFQENTLVVKAHQAITVFQHFRDLGGQLSVTKDDLCALAELFARPHQTFPGLLPAVNEQQYLAGTAGLPLSDEPSRQNAGVIHHQAVTRAEKARQIIEMVVSNLPSGLVKGHQSGAVPAFQRSLGNQLRG